MDLDVPYLGTRNFPAGRWVENAVVGVAAAADSAAVLLGRDLLRGKCVCYQSFVAAGVAVSVNALALEHVGYLEDLWKGHYRVESYLLVWAKGVLVGLDSLHQLVLGHSEEKS